MYKTINDKYFEIKHKLNKNGATSYKPKKATSTGLLRKYTKLWIF